MERLDSVVILGWYFPECMGIICAARKNNINTFELQHGKQGKYQAMYSSWKSLNHINFYENMPNFFLNWDENSRNNILRSERQRKDHHPILFFNPEIIWNKLIFQKNF